MTTRDALYLDFDGTLVALASTPESLRVAPELAGILGRLRSLLGGALAVISGRRLESVDHWLSPLQLCGAGLHGAQLRLAPHQAAVVKPQPEVTQVVATLQAFYAADRRVLVEDKGASVALHFRLAPERAAECVDTLRRLAAEAGLDTVSGHAVIEARPRGIDKGVGLRRLAEVAPFAGRRPVFLGDDTTDEDAIIAAQALGGIGVRIGDAPSAAQCRLPDVAAVHAWLGASLNALEAGQ